MYTDLISAMAEPVLLEDVREAVRGLALSDVNVCVHSSLGSFGYVQGGAQTVISGILEAGCTLVLPTFSFIYAIAPPPNDRPAQNGWDYSEVISPGPGQRRVFRPASREIDRTMGTIPAEVLALPIRRRGYHPLCSFTAVGPNAEAAISGQTPVSVYAPLEYLERTRGWVILMGVDLDKLTLLHLAERRSGRRLFRRWANGPGRRPMVVETGGCSNGFPKLRGVLAPVIKEVKVGKSRWMALPVAQALELAADAIRQDPEITHCGDRSCIRCHDAVLGGPLTESV